MEKKDLSIIEAFELYRVEQIVYKNESARTEEMHGLVLRSLLEFFGGDIPISELTFDQIRKWKEWMQKNKKPIPCAATLLSFVSLLSIFSLRDIL